MCAITFHYKFYVKILFLEDDKIKNLGIFQKTK